MVISDEDDATFDASKSLTFDIAIAELTQEYCVMLKHPVETASSCDDLLQRLMTVLAKLPDIPIKFLQQLNTANGDDGNTFASTPNQLPVDDSVAWFPLNVLLGESSEAMPNNTLDKTSKDIANATTIRGRWEKGLVMVSLLSKLVSPTELHATASTSYYSVSGGTRFNRCECFHTTCLILCCQSLQRLTHMRHKIETKETMQPSWRRGQSLIFETLKLYDHYQRHHDGYLDILFSVSLWRNHVLPTTASWHHVLWNQHLQLERIDPLDCIGTWQLYMAYEAVSVALTGRLAIQLMSVVTENAILGCDSHLSSRNTALTSLVSSLNEHVLFGQYDLLCEHSWRYNKKFDQDYTLLYKSSIDKENGPTASKALAYFTVSTDSDQDDETRRDLVCGLSSVWPETDIALLSAVAWNSRPNVWSIAYQWRLFFPQVSVLLAAGVTDETDNLESLKGNEAVELYGYQLLQNLLNQTTTQSLPKNSCRNVRDSPVGTCQLLANRMVDASITISKRRSLPNAVETYHIMKLLVEKYFPLYQLEIVEKLMQCCPYLGLRPKFVDFLRGFIGWNDTLAEAGVWHIVENMLFSNLEDRISNMSSDSATDCLIVSLSDDAELFSATLGLLQVWIMRKRTIPDVLNLNNLPNRLVNLHFKLLKILKQHSMSMKTKPAQYVTVPHNTNPLTLVEPYRLNIFESSLQRTIDVMAELTKK
jgi:hypothetical protein